MPTIKDFGGFRVCMYFEDHGTPHFHVVGPEFGAKVAIGDLTILAGHLPRRAREALEWAEGNRARLLELWMEYSG